MRLRVLGSGTCELKHDRSSPSYLVQAGATSVVLDLGQGAWRRLLEAGVEAEQVDGVLLSHHHLDHCADLLPLLFALNYDPVLSREARMTLVADRGFAEIFEGLEKVFGDWLRPPQEVLERRLVAPGFELELGDLKVVTERALHIETSLAYRLQWQGKSVVYLGDSRLTPALVDLAGGADLLICHCVGHDDDPSPNHMHPAAAGEMAAEAGVKLLLISHLYRSQDIEQTLAGVRSRFTGPLRFAEDHIEIELG